MLTYKEYHESVVKNMRSKPEFGCCESESGNIHLIFNVMGLAGECGEIILLDKTDKDFEFELGDILWYTFSSLHILGSDTVKSITEFYNHHALFTVEMLVSNSLQVSDRLKKMIYHRHGLDKSLLSGFLHNNIKMISSISKNYYDDPSYIAKLNIEKLSKRYPNGFTVEDSKKHCQK